MELWICAARVVRGLVLMVLIRRLGLARSPSPSSPFPFPSPSQSAPYERGVGESFSNEREQRAERKRRREAYVHALRTPHLAARVEGVVCAG